MILRSIKHQLEYFGLKFLEIFICLLPLKAGLFVGRRLGNLTFSVLRIRRKVVKEQIAQVFPGIDFKERTNLAKATYRNLGQMLIEFLRVSKINQKTLLSFVEMQGVEHLISALKPGRGVVLVSAHLGNWEYVGGAMGKNGLPITIIYKKQTNFLVNQLIEKYRLDLGMQVIPRDHSPGEIIRALKENRIVGFLVDQDAGREGIFVDFLGRPASTPRGPAVLALKTGAQIVLVASIRLDNGKHRAIFEHVNYEKYNKFSEKNIQQITQLYMTAIEKYIRRYPEQWLWMHRRWKTRPVSQYTFTRDFNAY